MIAHLNFNFRSLLFALALMLISGYLTSCSDDSTSQDGPTQCAPDEVFNPLQGCVSSRIDPNRDAGDELDAGDANTPPESDIWVPPDVTYDPDANTVVDVEEEQRCAVELDSDDDGLNNSCECRLGTDPGNSDSDGDGVPDGIEDANQNCVYDVGVESNPREADTDHDGLNDGGERLNGTDYLNPDSDGDGVPDGAEVTSGCMNPRVTDTDGDGIPDGDEDRNGDGLLGMCANRVFATECAQGESDPCSADTNGDGVNDGEEAAYLACSPAQTANLVAPQLLSSSAGNYQLALQLGVASAQASGLTTGHAHAFNDPANRYAGFIGAWTTSVTGATALRDEVVTKIQGMYPGSSLRDEGQRSNTHDGHHAVIQVELELHGVTDVGIARDDILAKLAGGVASHSLTGTFAPGTTPNPLIFTFEAIRRGSNGYIVAGAVARQSDLANNTLKTGFLVSDITGGSAVAEAGETLVEQCVSYRVDNRPQVDFIWIIDSSGSMSNEIEQVRQFADDFVAILQASDVDWRLGVTSASCSAIANDPGVSADAKAFLGGAGISGGCPEDNPPLPFPIPIPITFSPYKNGILCDLNGANFTRDPQKFKDCVNDIAGDESLEFSMSMALPTIDRALPRTPDNPLKIRPDAAIVVISVTDEFDQYVENEMNWSDSGSGGGGNDPTLNSNFDSIQLDNILQPVLDYLDRPNIDATLFGIHWIAGEACSSAAEAAAGIGRVATATGGSSGSICASDLTGTLTDIANASVGLAAGIRLRGTPAPPTIATKVGEVATGQIVESTRSRVAGWDYDSRVNRVIFTGPVPLRDEDRVIVPYLRWDGSLGECQIDADCPRGMKFTCIDNMCR